MNAVAWLDYGGLFVFALSGASLAARKRFDVVGLVVLAEVTAIGGGVLRDLIIGAVPPAAFSDTAYVAIPLLAAMVVFVFHRSLDRIARAVLVFDAAGLAFYCVAGAGKAMAYGLGPLPAILLGVTSAVGGGVLRDVLAGETPVIMRRESELYAVPACAGAAMVVLAGALGPEDPAVAIAAVAATFLLRLLAMWRHWRAPAP